ncbi:hypothetical protein CCACVL1_13203 [Corchorus capsularis]|uniref:Sec23/Sec24 trunk domain-containing protein n=1 Tax=Corchorus capsularis TaxID=210143 RepID=A0A1R3IBT2_COCAP|nr:hypothetical protein CCACVL1_13203 [Corchorus capsularis]
MYRDWLEPYIRRLNVCVGCCPRHRIPHILPSNIRFKPIRSKHPIATVVFVPKKRPKNEVKTLYPLSSTSSIGVVAGYNEFLLPVSDCVSMLNVRLCILCSIRCTGVALRAVADLLVGACLRPGTGARIIALVGGPFTEGPGKIVSKHFDKDAAQFYKTLAEQLVSQGHVLDLFASAIDREISTCSTRQHKLTEFRAKLQDFAAAAPSPQPQPHSSVTKTNGRVLYPIGYGADPTGVQDSADAILQAMNDAFQLQSGLEMLPGVVDLGGVEIDLLGGSYKISKPLRFPASGGANVVVKGGSLRASDTFPGDRHLIEVWSPNSQVLEEKKYVVPTAGFTNAKDQNTVEIYYEDITFQNILFDSSYRGGGIFIVDSARIRINNCFFLHFTTEGILVQRGHETFISSCFLGQHSTTGGDKGEKSFSGTAIKLSSNDNGITDVVIFSAAIGIEIEGQANIVTGVHCYNKATAFGGVGILVKSGASLTRIDNCYLDFTAIVMEDPVQVHVTNGLFLGDANVVLKSIKGQISGLNIVNNMFNGNARNMVPIIQLDGKFSSIDQVVIEKNNVNGMSLKSTVGKLMVTGNGTKWVADFSSILVFPDRINHFEYSFRMAAAAGFPAHAVTNVSNNVVVIESDKAVNGVVSVAVDQ